MRNFLIVLGVICVSFGWGISAHALSISPVTFDYTVDPGETVSGKIRILNDTDVPQTYYAVTQNFIPDGEEGHQTFLPESDQSQLAGWIHVGDVKVVLNPGDQIEFPWTAIVPVDSEPGGHYAAIFFSTRPPDEPDAVGVGAKTGALILLNVNGDIRESATLETFQYSNPDGGAVFSRLPIRFTTRIRNTGSVHFRPDGKIHFRNMFGGDAGVADANPTGGRVLPNSIRRIIPIWGNESKEMHGSFLSELVEEWRGFGFGKYTARLDMSYGRQRQKLTGETTFWIIPWRLLSVTGAGLVLLIILIKGYNAIVVRSAMQRMRRESP